MRLIGQLIHGLKDATPGRLGDRPLAAHHVRDGALGDTGLTSNVLAREAGHASLQPWARRRPDETPLLSIVDAYRRRERYNHVKTMARPDAAAAHRGQL